MTRPLTFCAALCVALLSTSAARAQTDLYVGSNTPANTLDLTNGTNAYANTYVGFTVEASNNALGVYNAGTLLTNTSELFVGNRGSGNTMTVADGAVVAAVISYMSYWAVSSNNSVLVTGTNSMWQNSSALLVGYSGNGNRLVISNGGAALNAIGSVGYFGSNNIVEVTGAGSLWTNTGDLQLGYETNANGNQLVVSNGGTVAANRLWVGYWRGSLSNSLVVTGTNSLLQASNVVVGRAGAGNQLVVSDGGTLASAQYGNLGQLFSSSNNVALVTGAGSLWTNALDLAIGGQGSGNRLTVSNAGTVANAAGVVGSSSVGNGNEVVVTGTNSFWTNSADLTIGNSGSSNSLFISNGGEVAVGTNLVISASAGASNNSVSISGGSLTVTNGQIDIGKAGSGTLNVTGGTVTVQELLATNGPDSVITFNGGTIISGGTTVSNGSDFKIGDTGSDATFIANGGTHRFSTNRIIIGFSGSSNRLVISNGGSAISDLFSVIGYASSASNNSVLVTGANSGWLSDALVVGGDGSGNSLVISNGGGVALAAAQTGGLGGIIGAGADSTSNSVLVTGSSSLWTNSGILYVGDYGRSNSLVISNAGTVANANVYIGYASNSAGNNVLVTGTGSVLVTETGSFSTNSNDLSVGEAGSGNSLVISNGGTVVNAAGTIGNTTTASNNSVLVTGSSSLWTNSNLLMVGNNGAGNSLIISNGGTVAVGASAIGVYATSSNNSVLVTGANSLLTNSSALYVGYEGSGSSLTVANGGSVAAIGIEIASVIGSSGTLNIGSFGGSDTAGTIIAPTIAFGTGTGAVNFNQSDAVTITSAISGAGTLNQLGAGTTTLSGTNTYTGTTTVAAGRLVVDGSIANSAVSVQNVASLSGSGVVGAISGAGSIDPGHSPGILTSTSLDPSGGLSLNFEFTGLNPVYSDATASVNDVLRLTAATPFVASLTVANAVNIYFNVDLFAGGQVYTGGFFTDTQLDFLSQLVNGDFNYYVKDAAGTVSYEGGTYAALGAGLTIDLTTVSQSGDFAAGTVNGQISQFEVVPEPSTYALLALAAAGLGAHLLRRRSPES